MPAIDVEYYFSSVHAEDTKLPPALKAYMGRRVAQTMHYAGAPWLIREGRQREEDCATLLKSRLSPSVSLSATPAVVSNIPMVLGRSLEEIRCASAPYVLKKA